MKKQEIKGVINMGRKRSVYHNLPPHMSLKGSVYYYVTSGNPRRWIRLSNDIREAKRLWTEIENSESPSLPGTFAALVDKFIERDFCNYSKKTLEDYYHYAAVLKECFGHMPVTSIRTSHVEDFLKAYPYPVAANRAVTLMSNMMDRAVAWDMKPMTTVNPCSLAKLNKERERKRYIDDEEFKKLLDTANDQFKIVLILAYSTAMRKGDLMRIYINEPPDANPGDRIAYVNPNRTSIFVRQYKTDKPQRFRLDHNLQNILHKAIAMRPANAVFLFGPRRSSDHYTVSGFNTAWRRVRDKSGVLDCHFHDIRAKAATDGVKHGMDHQLLLGHTDKKMSDKYVKLRLIDDVDNVPVDNFVEAN